MTKLRWNDPPKEHDPANYNPDHDPKVRFSGTKDGSDLTERQKILNRLIEIDDLLTHYSGDYNSASSTQRGFLLDDDVKKYEELSNFDASFNRTAEGDALIVRIISSLKAEQLELKKRLDAFPRVDRF
ncbi:hypothetical protein [Brevundimonas diminuta]|uniref:hypothetical protein n=1 Tax=Brevundimonas diminuta TaxID=293 RepID=UPI000FE23619|nr:hypothetical protein [Brevundimonas diminuta]